MNDVHGFGLSRKSLSVFIMQMKKAFHKEKVQGSAQSPHFFHTYKLNISLEK
ncbi:hypothetical protein GCM10010954_24870 [Halobacillus andaensis]|uniref:Uncharacterized protein n=1 Tax=Halobacillus andaensis TaxID=1176239 RepID=A0A917B8C1_HALAA|nr:hypothetical protein [Halobacillus andaensis]GGF24967.1 hypothetical protein GCM10010954_24870 [Halobacillus andaensis]